MASGRQENLQATHSLVLVLGDQLDARSAAFDDFDVANDAVWMAEAAGEATHVWSHKARIAFFLSAMRHFRNRLEKNGLRVHYTRLGDARNRGSLAAELERAVHLLRPGRLVMVEAGEWRVAESIRETAASLGIELDVRPDKHFLCPRETFEEHAAERKQLRLEYFYRMMRRRTGILMEGDRPAGERWNFDAENRESFGSSGPPTVEPPRSFEPDAVTREVFADVEAAFGSHPGSLKRFDWPVTARQARVALKDFVAHRLESFGRYQDAMWSGEPYLFHSRLSAAMNLKLLDPRDVLGAAVEAFGREDTPLAAVEGFVRQILGWREYVRGVYWHSMPDYESLNHLAARLPLPDFYWTADTDMRCLREVIEQTLAYGYAHHIQRLMVTGLFALLLGVDPGEVHRWYLAIYVDAVEWVELPNTLGMSQFADGGLMASKPYAATGKYIDRMSDYCKKCRYDPAEAAGADACPFTTLYWNFLERHSGLLLKNTRMRLQLRNLARKAEKEIRAIRERAEQIRTEVLS